MAEEVIKDELGQEIEEKVSISWLGPERPMRVRSREFFGTISVLAILVAIVLFFIEGFMPVLLVGAVMFVVIMSSRVEPKMIEYRISNKGIMVGGAHYAWEEMTVFWDESSRDGEMIHVLTIRRWPLQVLLILPKKGEVTLETVKKEIAKKVRYQKPPETRIDKGLKWFNEKVPLE